MGEFKGGPISATSVASTLCYLAVVFDHQGSLGTALKVDNGCMAPPSSGSIGLLGCPRPRLFSANRPAMGRSIRTLSGAGRVATNQRP